MKHRYIWLISLLLLLLITACSGTTETEEQPSVEDSPASTVQASAPTADAGDDLELNTNQQKTYDQISDAAGFEPELLVEQRLPRFIAPYLPVSSEDPETAARAFFAAYPDLFGVQNLDDALRLESIRESDSGTVVRFQQYLDGVPVYSGHAVVIISPDGLISEVNSALQPSLSVPTEPQIDQQQAQDAAIQSSGDDQAVLAREPQLMVFSPQVIKQDESDPFLVWEIGLLVDQGDGGPPATHQYLVDAQNGEIVFDVPEDLSTENWDLSTAQNSATSDPTPQPLYDKVLLWYTMRDGNLTPAVDGNGQPLADAEGMVTQANMSTTWDYFFNTHDWDGHDDGGGTCSLTVHVGSGWRNATCGKTCNCLFGDSGGGWGSLLDIVAHEFTHAITGQTSGLIYELESGALNEHFSDFFGTMVETSDWLLSGPTFFRSLADPPNGSRFSPDHWDEFMQVEKPNKNNDNGRVHRNSGIPNKAAFLVGDTGTNVHPDSGIEVQGLGRSIAEQIWFQTLISLGPSTGLEQWASSTVRAAFGLAPGTITFEEACQVQYAMQAVGLREPDCRCDDEVECPLGGYGDQYPSDVGTGNESESTDTSPSQEPGTGTSTPEPEPTQGAVLNACDHPYMPIRPGSTWYYLDNEGQSLEYIVRQVTGDENYAEAIVDAVIVAPELTVTLTHTWTCDREGIRAPLTSMSGIPEGVEATVFGEEEGVLLPIVENLTFGSQWNYNTLIKMDFSSAAGAMQVTNDRQEEFTSVRMSNVSVPAGDFEALEISGQFTVTTDVGDFTQDFFGTEMLMFAEGVGMVFDQVEQDGTYLIELVDYFIPER